MFESLVDLELFLMLNNIKFDFLTLLLTCWLSASFVYYEEHYL